MSHNDENGINIFLWKIAARSSTIGTNFINCPQLVAKGVKALFMILLLNIIEALRAIRSNFLRTILTMMIIAAGLTALIGVLTSIDGIKFWFSNSFVRLGSNTFRVENYGTTIRRSGRRGKRQSHDPITYSQALDFKSDFESDAPVSVIGTGNFASICKYQNKSTQGNILLLGADENYVDTDNYTIDLGRNLNSNDIRYSRNVILIGFEVVNVLFQNTDPIDKTLYVDGKGYKIIGTFEEIGSQGMMGGDKICIIPNSTLQKDFPDPYRSFSLHVYVPKIETLDDQVYESIGLMRRIRQLKPTEEDDFGVIKLEAILGNFMENLRYLTWSATIIALITLMSAAIGLMNIMLVSVTERTREIGLRKALGATKGQIMFQFLTEAAVITQLGGAMGIFIGILLGNLIGWLLGSGFIVPWNWVIAGFGICFAVGMIAGWYPAKKAASLDPIEALRHE